MSCQFGQEHRSLSLDYAAGRLSPGEAHMVLKHLESCEECAERFGEFGEVWSALDDWRIGSVSPGFDERLMARISVQESQSSWAARLWRFAASPVLSIGAVSLTTALALVISVAPLHLRYPGSASPVTQTERIDVDQVERTLDDLAMLRLLEGTRGGKTRGAL